MFCAYTEFHLKFSDYLWYPQRQTKEFEPLLALQLNNILIYVWNSLRQYRVPLLANQRVRTSPQLNEFVVIINFSLIWKIMPYPDITPLLSQYQISYTEFEPYDLSKEKYCTVQVVMCHKIMFAPKNLVIYMFFQFNVLKKKLQVISTRKQILP